MKPRIRCIPVLFLVVAPMLAHAEERLDAAAHAKAVAPFVEAETIVVVHADLSRISLDPLFDTLARLSPEALVNLAKAKGPATERRDQFLRAGGRHVYLVVTLGGDGPYPRMLAVVPLRPGTEEGTLRTALQIPPNLGQRMGDAIVIPVSPFDKQPLAIHPAQRPELAAAFGAAGDTAVQGLLIPPASARRVIEELLPHLPSEIGNGPSTIFTRGVSWAAVGLDLLPHFALRVVVQARDAQTAESLRTKWSGLVRFAGRQKEVRQFLPRSDNLAALLVPRVEGDRLTLALDENTPGIRELLTAVEAPAERAPAKPDSGRR